MNYIKVYSKQVTVNQIHLHGIYTPIRNKMLLCILNTFTQLNIQLLKIGFASGKAYHYA